MENQDTISTSEPAVESNPSTSKLSFKERIKLKTAKYDKEWRRKNRKKLLLVLLLLLLLLLLCCGCCFGTIVFIRDRQTPTSSGDEETTSSQSSSTTSQEAGTTSSVEASSSSSVAAITPIIEGPSLAYQVPVDGNELQYKHNYWAVSLEGKSVPIPLPDTGVQLMQKKFDSDWAFYVISDIENPDTSKYLTGLRAINLKTREIRTIVEPNLDLRSYQVFGGRISPNGRYFTYSIGACQFELLCTGLTEEIKAKFGMYIYDLTTNKSTKLTTSFGSQNWSSDSSAVYILTTGPVASEGIPAGYFKVSIADAKRTLLVDKTNNFYDSYFPLANGNFFKLGVDSTNTKVTATITNLAALSETVDSAFFTDYTFVNTTNPRGDIVIYMRKSPLVEYGNIVVDIYMYNTTTKVNKKLYAGTESATIRGVAQWLDENRFIANMNIDQKDQGLGSDVIIFDIRDSSIKKLTNDKNSFVGQQ